MNIRSAAITVIVVMLAVGVWLFQNRSETAGRDEHAQSANIPAQEQVQNASSDDIGEGAGDSFNEKPEPPNDEDGSLASLLGVPKGKPVMVDFGRKTCIPCKEMAKNIEAAEKKIGDKAVIIFIDTGEEPKLAQYAGITIIPTQVFFDADGNEVGRNVGVLSVGEIVNRLTGE